MTNDIYIYFLIPEAYFVKIKLKNALKLLHNHILWPHSNMVIEPYYHTVIVQTIIVVILSQN